MSNKLMTPATKKMEQRRLRDLTPHRLLKLVNLPRTQQQVEEDAAKLTNQTVQQIQILPDGVVLVGAELLPAYSYLKRDLVDVIVRHDLADLNSEELDDWLLKQVEAQGSPLTQARVLRFRFERNKPRKEWIANTHSEFLKAVEAATGKERRSVNRYVAILQTPIEVQQAFEAKHLALVPAAQVALLSDTQQQAIAEALREGQEARQVVAAYLPKPQRKKSTSWRQDEDAGDKEGDSEALVSMPALSEVDRLCRSLKNRSGGEEIDEGPEHERLGAVSSAMALKRLHRSLTKVSEEAAIAVATCEELLADLGQPVVEPEADDEDDAEEDDVNKEDDA